MSLVRSCHAKSVSGQVCLCLDYVWISRLFINKLHLRSSLRSPSVDSIKEYTTRTMNPVVDLLSLRQGNRPLEDYMEDFCHLCHVVGFNDVVLKGIFCNGLKDCLKDLMPNSNGSATLEEYIDFALLLSGSSFTVGIADEKPCNPTEPTAPVYFHIPAVMSGVAHVMSAKPQPAHVMSATPGPAHVMLTTQEVLHNMAAIQELSCKMAATQDSLRKMAAILESRLG